MDSKNYHHGNLRRNLIDKGIELINKDGIQKLSLRKLAKECGVSEAAPYSHFKNKEDFITAMQEDVMEQFMECLEKSMGDKKVVDPQTIGAMGKAYVSFFLTHPDYYDFLFTQPCFKADLSMKDNPDNFPPFELFRKAVTEAYAGQGYTPDKLKYGIISMWATVHGLAAIAAMKNVSTDFDWEEKIEEIIKG